MGQTPPEIDFCGAITKPPLPNGQTAQYYDRFGNAYTDADFPYPGGSSGTYKGMCNSGYFDLVFVGAWSSTEEATICKVFNDLSGMIDNPANATVNLFIEKVALNNGVLGTGSPIWEADCGIADSRIVQRLNNIYPFGGTLLGYLGFMQIHQSATEIWHTIADDIAGAPNLGIQPGKYDLYSVALHEALHILGFAARISPTGSPLNEFYSRWDSFLYSDAESVNLINASSLPDCCSAHNFNNGTFTNMPNDFGFGCSLQLAFRNSTGAILAPVNVANYTEFGGTSGNSIFLNKLSHLDISCSTALGLPANNYVMHAGISAQEIKRNLTDAETEILCALGYHVSNTPGGVTCQQPCEVFTNPDNYQIFLTGNAANNPLQIPLWGINGILANDVAPTTANITFDPSCLYIGDLIINLSTIPSNYITITASTTGIFQFCYTVESCSGYCQTETVTIMVRDNPLEIHCNDPYCNIVCFGDFEGFTPNYQYPEFELGVTRTEFAGHMSSPQARVYDGNQVLVLVAGSGFDWDVMPIPLSEPIPPGCEISITFNATAINANTPDVGNPTLQPTLQFTALSAHPCPSFSFPNCTSGVFPVCPASTGTAITAANMTPNPCGLPINFQGIPHSSFDVTVKAIDFNNLPVYTFSWTNTTGQPVTTLLLNTNTSLGNIPGAYRLEVFIDNLIVIPDCGEHISITVSDTEYFCTDSNLSLY